MKNIIRTAVKSLINPLGIDVVRYQKEGSSKSYPEDFSEQTRKVCDAVKPYTMTSPERINAVVEAVRYLVKNKIDGDMVECGVWKGGASMAMALTLNELGDQSRELYLYDTYSGMSKPTDEDVSLRGGVAHEKFAQTKMSDDTSDWCFSPVDEVKKNLLSTGYPKEKMHFIQGKVEETIPKTIPSEIALLRLDTDWYESTKHELIHLFPLLKKDGVLIIDDYGHWQGARKAVDEYIAEKKIRILLNRTDYTGRIAIKV